jgi:cytochrome c biogenesis protein CcmG, thiol:disulfide interchange protein DsbE
MTSLQQGLWIAWVGLVLPVVLVLGLFAAGTVRHQQTLAVSAALARGDTPQVPALTLPAFGGPPVALTGLRGHPVIVNFWASWCVPCREEAPQLEAIWKEFRGRGLIVLGIDTRDLETPARAFLTQYTITYRNVRDPDGSAARLFGTTGVPETFFISADGRISGKFPGEQIDSAVWQQAAAALLAGRTHVP